MITRLACGALLLFALSAQSAVLFSTNSTWRFLRGTNEASSPDTTAWRGTNFNDVNFANASSPFWYGDVRDGGTQLSDMQNTYTCIFLRKTFNVSNLSEVGGLRLTYYIDDGFVAWINGTEVYRERVTDPITTSTLAGNQDSDPAPFTSTLVFPVTGFLKEGVNVIAIQGFNTSSNSSDFGFDLILETVIAETNPPTIVNVTPAPGSSMTSLTSLTVTFSEPVLGVNADDLLLNTQPASSVTANGNAYTFTFPQPFYGNVSVTWFPDHGITDQATPPNSFNHNAPGSSWMYDLNDVVPPTASVFPAPSVTVRSISQVEVTFSEEVSGVNAADLLINGQPATNVFRPPAGPYVFQFATPPPGTVQVQWAEGHGIVDQAETPNAFAGGSWSYTYDPNASVGDLVINEILASNTSTNGILDDDDLRLGEVTPVEWIEIYNRGSNAVDLANWSLSDNAELSAQWEFPSVLLAPGEYLIVLGSGKNIRSPAPGNKFHTNFRLSRGGEFLGLYAPASPRLLVSSFSPDYPEQRNNVSYGYDSGGNLRYFSTPTPGGPNGNSTIVGVCDPVHFNVTRGFYTRPFDLALSCPTPNVTIRYTRDGSEPTPSSAVYLGPLRLTNTTLIRATAFRPDFLPSRSETHSYLFNFTATQRSLPVLNIVTGTNNLIGRTGIMGMNGGSRSGDGAYITNNPATDYHNPTQHGIAWERPVSAEWIEPQDNSGFQIDCGIRIQGSDWQRPRTTAASKFSYRLYFRSDYGQGRLRAPLFPLTPVENFDQIVLRAGFNEQVNPFIRDEITRRLSHDMGQVASHGTVALVLLNGGPYTNNAGLTPIYNPCERVHDAMLQAHLGGGEDWDVVAPSFAVSAEGTGVVDGDRNNFNTFMTNFWGASLRPITNQAAYTRVSKLLDLPNFVDYCLLNAYVAMGDWPANNWRAARERSTNGIWRFIVWDAEWAMGIYALPVTRDSFAFTGTGTEDAGLNSTVNSEIARIYQALRPNPEFRLLWADRIHKHFFNGGALTGGNISNRFNELRLQLTNWFPVMDTEILQWARDRYPIIMGQFNTYGLYGLSNATYGVFASSNAPVYNVHGGRIAPGFSLTMSAPLGGTIYYTTNGDDPRVIFTGAVSNSASSYSTPITLNQSMVVKARTLLNGTNWSALAEAPFEVGLLGPSVRITEINYNPIEGAAFEFIELKNIGVTPVDLSGMTFDGITFQFNEGTSLAPGATIVLISNDDPAAFMAQHPTAPVAGEFGGNLSNGGERISLRDRFGNIITSVDYRDSGGWPTAADFGGHSLELLDVFGNPDDPNNWRASSQAGGSPGVFTPFTPAVPQLRINEVMAENISSVNNGNTFPDYIELHNASGSAVNVGGWSLSDDGDPRKFVFPPNTMIGGNNYLVVWCDDATNTTPGLHTGFALDRDGESVFLYNASTSRVDAVTYGLQAPNYSVGRIGGSGEWQLNSPTAGAANSAATLGLATNVGINEWLANAPGGSPDWIELYNRNAGAPAPLGGSYVGISNSVHQLPPLSFLGPLSFVQLIADEEPGNRHLDFKLPASGGRIVLYDRAGRETEAAPYTAQLEGVSQGRLPDGSLNVVSFPGTVSPEASNYTNSFTGPYINEVLARNISAVSNNAGLYIDWIEIYNPTGSNYNLAGMSLSLESIEPGQWVFPTGTTVGPNSYLLIWCDETLPASTTLEPNLNTGRALDGESGGVYLFNAVGQLLNSVEYGFQLRDKSIGLASGVWRLLASPTPGAANSAAETLGAVTGLRINEWFAEPERGGDWFELYNPAASPVQLGSLFLTDDLSTFGERKFQIATLSFIPANGFVKWEADNDPDQGRNHVNFNLDGDGEALRLSSSNSVIDTVIFSEQERAVSEGRDTDGGANIVTFPGSATPGASNYRLIPGLRINEVLAHNVEQRVELFNSSSNSLAVGGWYLSNDPAQLQKYRIPDNTTIAPGGYLVISATQFASGPNAFTLNRALGGELWLTAMLSGAPTGQRATIQYPATKQNISAGPYVTTQGTDIVPLSANSLGSVNAAPQVGPVVISEIMYDPVDDASGYNYEYIELHNLSGGTVQLFDPVRPNNRWSIAGGVQFTFPASAALNAGEYALVVGFDPVQDTASLNAFQFTYSLAPEVKLFGPYLGKLDNAGEDIVLYQPDLPDGSVVPKVLVEKVEYSDGLPWPSGSVNGGGLSLQRRQNTAYGNEPLNWVAGQPTPGANNSSGIVQPPTITQHPTNQTVALDSSANLSVAVNGDAPFSYRWRRNGIQIPDATNSTFTIMFAEPEDTGDYDVLVGNAAGTALSSSARIFVPFAPQILDFPVSRTIRSGSNTTFSVFARGGQPLYYQWRFKGIPIANATGTSLVLTNVQFSQNGEYDVVVSNSVGIAIASAELTVLYGPFYVIQPQDVTVTPGEDAVFSATATGTEPFLWRWRRNGAQYIPFTVGLNSITVTNVQLTNNNVYYETVVANTNNQTGVLSRRAFLYVLADNDGDHIPDAWESAYGMNTNDNSNAHVDTDNDSLSNYEEYIAGTNPTNSLSYLKVESLLTSATNTALITFNGVSNKTYSIMYRDGLTPGAWSKLTDVATGTSNRVVTVADPDVQANVQRYYRLLTPRLLP